MPVQKRFRLRTRHGAVVSRGGDGQLQFFYGVGCLMAVGCLEREGLCRFLRSALSCVGWSDGLSEGRWRRTKEK